MGRITPACAGKRQVYVDIHLRALDHPRLCGEKSVQVTLPSRSKGSPPPVRGKDVPAYAFYKKLGDHPRLCGEKTKKIPEFRHFAIPCYSFSLSLRYS